MKQRRNNRNTKDDSKNYKNTKRVPKEPDTTKNDASWYTRNNVLVADSGKIAFTWPTGIPVDLEAGSESINGRAGGNLLMPGIMALSYVPTYGADQDGYDPLNIAAQNVYAYVRHVQSGHSNYDASDLMLYIMAMDQIYALYMHLVRAYGVIRLFSQKNRNYPRVIMNALGFDYDDVANHLADFRYYINNAATRIGAMIVPNNMPIIARHMWMPAGLYADGPSAKAQLYAFRPQAFGIYNEKGSDHGGYLSVQFMAYKHTVEEWCGLLDTMIAAVRASEDCGIMSGDILKAFGDNVIKLPFISEDYVTNVIYSPEVLGQIANATVLPDANYTIPEGFSDSVMMYQVPDDNILKSALVFSMNIADNEPISLYNAYKGKRVMLGLSEQPTPEEVMVNSRLMVILKSITATSSNRAVGIADSTGSEVVVEAAMFDTENMEGFHSASSHAMNAHQYLHYINPVTEFGANRFGFVAMAKANYYNLHPCFNIASSVEGQPGYNMFYDVDNYAIVDRHDIAKMHDTALLSMLDVPLLGSAK